MNKKPQIFSQQQVFSQQQLPTIQDPSYWGMVLVKNFLPIIASLFIVLALGVFITTSLTSLDITIKANVDSLEKCPEDSKHYCAFFYMTEAEAQQITLDNPARIEVKQEDNYRRHTLVGKVVSISQTTSLTTEHNKKLLPYQIKVKLEARQIGSNISPTVGLIIVGSQSAWSSLTSALFKLF